MTSHPEVARNPRTPKPAAGTLGVDLATLDWRRSGTRDGSIEIALVADQNQPGGWVLFGHCLGLMNVWETPLTVAAVEPL